MHCCENKHIFWPQPVGQAWLLHKIFAIFSCCIAGSDCVTPSNPLGLSAGHGVEFGEGLDIWQVLQKLKSAS